MGVSYSGKRYAFISYPFAPDTPFLRTYKVDYLNLSREATSPVATSTAVITGTPEGGQAGAGGGGSSNNDSTTDITNETDHRFWETLAGNLLLILAGDGGPGVVQGRGGEGEVPQSESVIVNREAGCELPALGYTGAYAFANVLLTIAGSLILLL